MLRKFSVRNFKNFKEEIAINFDRVSGYQFSQDCITDGFISKMLIYGRNATGKTNLGEAIMDINYNMFGRTLLMDTAAYLNADSKEDSAVFSYTFCFDESELIYQYARLANRDLKSEMLMVNGIVIFECDFAKEEYTFSNLQYIQAETANTDRYIESLSQDQETEVPMETGLPFLRWIVSNVALDNSSILIRLVNYVRRMKIVNTGHRISSRWARRSSLYMTMLEKPDQLKDMENFLNAMGVDCRLEVRKLPDNRSKLYFIHDKLVPFDETASSGTLSLVDLYFSIIPINFRPSFIFLDEFDAFYHYEMAEKVIRFLKKAYPKCQVIMTSHNTSLMTNRLMRPDCMFILSGKGTLTALCDATPRELREGHNLEKMYISGEFERYE